DRNRLHANHFHLFGNLLQSWRPTNHRSQHLGRKGCKLAQPFECDPDSAETRSHFAPTCAKPWTNCSKSAARTASSVGTATNWKSTTQPFRLTTIKSRPTLTPSSLAVSWVRSAARSPTIIFVRESSC